MSILRSFKACHRSHTKHFWRISPTNAYWLMHHLLDYHVINVIVDVIVVVSHRINLRQCALQSAISSQTSIYGCTHTHEEKHKRLTVTPTATTIICPLVKCNRPKHKRLTVSECVCASVLNSKHLKLIHLVALKHFTTFRLFYIWNISSQLKQNRTNFRRQT